MLTLNSSSGDTADDVFSRKQEENDHRQDGDGCRSELKFRITAGIRYEGEDTKRDRTVAVGVDDQLYPHEGVPGGDRVQKHDRYKTRAGDRDHDAPQVFPVACAIDTGTVVQAVRNSIEEALKNVSVEDRAGERNDQDRQRIDQIQSGDCLVVRDDLHLKRDHHEGYEYSEYRFLAREFQPGETEGGKDRDEAVDRDAGERDDAGVQEVFHQRSLFKGFGEVFEIEPVGRDPDRRERVVFGCCFEGTGDHPVEREDHDDRSQCKEQIDQNFL